MIIKAILIFLLTAVAGAAIYIAYVVTGRDLDRSFSKKGWFTQLSIAFFTTLAVYAVYEQICAYTQICGTPRNTFTLTQQEIDEFRALSADRAAEEGRLRQGQMATDRAPEEGRLRQGQMATDRAPEEGRLRQGQMATDRAPEEDDLSILVGDWLGHATSGSVQLQYSWRIEQDGENATGTIALAMPGSSIWSTYRFVGRFFNDRLIFEGTDWIEKNFRNFCLASGELQYIVAENEHTLKGTWGPNSRPEGCPKNTGGNAILRRM
jgi:hypothetical protein